MKLVILDTYASTGKELDYHHFADLAEVTCYDRTPYDQIAKRIGDAELVITNKCMLDRTVLEQCPNVKYIGIIATGYNNVDLPFAAQRGITVTNVPAYSTKGVAQLVFAYILDAYSMVRKHDDRVHHGEWENCPDFCFYDDRLQELDGKTIGVVGFGSIAKRVAFLAHAFDMKVLVHTRTVREKDQKEYPYVTFTGVDELFMKSDILTIHCPLTEQTQGLVDRKHLEMMKPSAVLINTARGPIVEEQDLADALNSGVIRKAYADVVSAEPIHGDNPLLSAKNMVITPHIAWACYETRVRLIEVVYQNLKHYLAGSPVNVVNQK